MLTKPFQELLGQISPFPKIADCPQPSDREHRSPERAAIDRHYKIPASGARRQGWRSSNEK
jgi:hypothetical protein